MPNWCAYEVTMGEYTFRLVKNLYTMMPWGHIVVSKNDVQCSSIMIENYGDKENIERMKNGDLNLVMTMFVEEKRREKQNDVQGSDREDD